MEFETLSFEDALGYIEFYLNEAVEAGFEPSLCLAPLGEVYELLGAFSDPDDDGYCVGLDNEYVNEEVANRLALEMNVPIMIVADSQEELNAILYGTELDDVYGVPA